MNREYQKPDYTRCIANLANSVLGRFGSQPVGQTLPEADRILAKGHRNVVLFLLDGLGLNVLEGNLPEESFLRRHLVTTIDSVFPPTTVAATTSALSGLMPCQHSMPGWDCYFPVLDKTVSVFSGNEQDTGLPAADFDAAAEYCPYENIVDRIVRHGGEAYFATPFYPPFPAGMEGVCARIRELCARSGEKFIYAYYNEPDSTMHRTGIDSAQTAKMLRCLEQQLEQLADCLEDTVLLLCADHGHVNVRGVNINSYPAIAGCLLRAPAIEPRAASFYVREDKKEQFEREFTKELGREFILLTREQALASRLFGTAEPREGFAAMLGDYLALAVSDLCIFRSDHDVRRYKGHHAGLTADERVIPLISIEK